MRLVLMFFLRNWPCCLPVVWRMGCGFTLRTGCAVALVSVLADLTPTWVSFNHLSTLYASVFGGLAMGLGLLMLFRQRASLGGVNILALFLQERFGVRAGWVQMGVDLLIVLASLFVIAPEKVGLSILGALALNLVLAINHRSDRYTGVS